MFFQKGNAQTTEKAHFEEALSTATRSRSAGTKQRCSYFLQQWKVQTGAPSAFFAEKDKKASNILTQSGHARVYGQ